MLRFEKGDRVRVDIADETDPDHKQYHGEHGEIIEIFQDDAGDETGDKRDNVIYRIEVKGDVIDLRWRDVRPPLNN